jgi:hypothetical protein
MHLPSRLLQNGPIPTRVKSVSHEIRAAIGELVIEVTFMQHLAARLVAVAGMLLLQPGSKPFELAQKGAEGHRDIQGRPSGRSHAIVAARAAWPPAGSLPGLRRQICSASGGTCLSISGCTTPRCSPPSRT